MWNSLLTCCQKLSFNPILLLLEPWISADTTTTVYRDELEKKASSRKKLEISSSRDHIAYSKVPVLELPAGTEDGGHGGVDKKGGGLIRIKVKMTKEEAARLLSRCKDGGLLEFKDVAGELAKIPVNRVTVVSPNPICHPTLLGDIPEELEN